MPKIESILITLFIFCYSWTFSVQGQASAEEHKKLAGYILKGIFQADEVMNEVLPRVPSLIMLEFHLKEKKVDNVSIQCQDTIVAAAMAKIRYDKFLINWNSLFPETYEEALRNMKVTLCVPVFIIKDLDQSNKPVFSKDDVEAILGSVRFYKTDMHYIKNSILIKPLEIRISNFR